MLNTNGLQSAFKGTLRNVKRLDLQCIGSQPVSRQIQGRLKKFDTVFC